MSRTLSINSGSRLNLKAWLRCGCREKARQMRLMLLWLSPVAWASERVLSLRLKKLVPYDSIAVYVRQDDKLYPQHVAGDDFRLFSSLEIPMGQGLSGWV